MGCLYGDGYRDDGAHRAVGHYETARRTLCQRGLYGRRRSEGIRTGREIRRTRRLECRKRCCRFIERTGHQGRQALCADGRVEQQGKSTCHAGAGFVWQSG